MKLRPVSQLSASGPTRFGTGNHLNTYYRQGSEAVEGMDCRLVSKGRRVGC